MSDNDDFDIDSWVNGIGDGPDNSSEPSLQDNLPDPAWVPEAAIEALAGEKQLNPSRSMSDITKSMIDDSAPVVMQSILNIALRSKSEATRFRASAYLLDRALGRVGEEKTDDSDSPLEKMFARLDDLANAGERSDKVGD